MTENAIQGMKEFKLSYVFNNTKVEPEGLFRVGEKIFNECG